MEKLVTSYKLFDQWDSNLLRLSQSILHHVTDAFIAALEPIAANRVVTSSAGSRRDLQSDILAKKMLAIFNRFPKQEPRFLDFGAGRGRLLKELLKEGTAFWSRTKWSLWEPNPDLRRELWKTFTTEGYRNVEILNRVPLHRNRYHIIIAANVIHELSPVELASLLCALWSNLHPSGSVFFVEVYPLLDVERLAVPYERNDLHDLLRAIGWSTEDESLNIRNASVTAYWLRAQKNSTGNASKSKVKTQIELLWRRILARRCGNYTARQVGLGGAQVADLISDWCAIASIQSYFTGHW